MIPFMVTNESMIDIVSQARDKAISFGHRRNLDHGNTASRNQISEERDVQLERWYGRVGDWLTLR
jgi:hypothetical protein